MIYPVLLRRKLFFDLLANDKIFGLKDTDSQIERFLIYAGATRIPVPQTIKNWIDTERSVKTTRYFSTVTRLNHIKLFTQLRKEPDSRLKSLQNNFKPYKEFFIYIDTETSNLDNFCKSLINQFSGFVGLNLPTW